MNTNYLWSKIFVARLVKLGVKHVCISPGSRNTTLIYAFAKCKQIKKYVIIDERTCGFFALGLADKTKTPVCVVITSGTAVAELYPAIIEAFKRRVPLIICSADRPPELHNCGSNQTINQENIFKNHIRAYYNAGVPEINEVKINYLLTITDMVFEKATITDIGPVHINFPFKKPLEPKTNDINISDNENKKYLTLAKTIFKNESSEKRLNLNIDSIFKVLSGKPKGLIIAGLYTNKTDFSLIAKISNKLNYPILADGLSGFRLGKHSKTNVIINYSSYINSELFESKYKADIILRFGQTPTSKQLLEYYKKSEAYKIIISKFG
ncbi:MAG: 2-succinyl-5-enolpyruvyl-6-hydroxy-3-cyclohexene-1-carboxylic-acid synthase, partial [Ignavibacteriales bacterium]|nr:2-succinyl-5-enolpyruvyl-6-hydroxy-3-cyclohexene-1-carboxylic-acid synthase [Ignavibacteriales bacterium]